MFRDSFTNLERSIFKVKESTVAILRSCFIKIIRSFLWQSFPRTTFLLLHFQEPLKPLKRDGFYRDILANVSGGNCHNYDPFTQLEMFWTRRCPLPLFITIFRETHSDVSGMKTAIKQFISLLSEYYHYPSLTLQPYILKQLHPSLNHQS